MCVCVIIELQFCDAARLLIWVGSLFNTRLTSKVNKYIEIYLNLTYLHKYIYTEKLYTYGTFILDHNLTSLMMIQHIFSGKIM